MTVNIYLDDLKEDKRLEVIFALGDDLENYLNIPLVSIDFEEGAVF